MDLVRFRYGENNVNTGPLKEIPEICVDHFLGNDLNSSIFLLSHAHTDHLVGLETEDFIRRLRQPGVVLYCHPLTPILLGSFTRYLQGPTGIHKLIAERKIVPLDVNKPKRIKIPRLTGDLDVQITLLPAGHCPGSVMFLIETDTIRILHTGDFRLVVEDLKRMPLLHKNGVPKPIDHLYVDTTFCCKSATLFPDRKQVLKEAFDHIRDWICVSKNNIIDIRFSAKFAHEFVLLEINRVFGQKIHVTPARYEIYEHIPEVYKIVTLDNQTQFHLCGDRSCVEDAEMLTIRLSSMWWTKTKEINRDSFVSWRGRKHMNLCYSMHSSLGEIAEMIEYLKPRIVTPLVLPSKSDISQVHTAIRSATETPYAFEDYRSSRNDFEGIVLPEVPCVEERDETDDLNIGMENLWNENDSQDGNNADSPSNELEESESPQKRIKLNDEPKIIWEYTVSPDSSKNSQSSSDDGGSSQEINAQEPFDDFVKPFDKKLTARRNLSFTTLSHSDETDDGGDQSSTLISRD